MRTREEILEEIRKLVKEYSDSFPNDNLEETLTIPIYQSFVYKDERCMIEEACKMYPNVRSWNIACSCSRCSVRC